MKNLKFLLKCILAASPIILIILFTWACPFAYMDKEYPAWRFSKAVAYGDEYEGTDFNTVILGDSGAMSSLKPELLSDSTVNLAVGGGTSIEAYYFLKDYLENHEAPENVVVMFAPFHYYTIDNFETRCQYFKNLSLSEACELYGYAKRHEIESVYNENTLSAELSVRLNLPTKYLPAITAAIKEGGRYSANISAYEDLVKTRGYGMFGTADGCDEASYESGQDGIFFSTDLLCIMEYLVRLYDLCNENDISMLILQPALNEASFNSLKESYINDYNNAIESLKAQLPEAVMETELRCYPNEYFGDVSHLNAKGAEKFSREILDAYPEYFECR